MSNFNLIHGSCADQNADAVVNTENSGLWEGGGNAGERFPDFAGFRFPLLGKKIYYLETNYILI